MLIRIYFYLFSNYESHDTYALGVDSPLDSLTGTNCLLSPLRKMDFALCKFGPLLNHKPLT